MACASAWASPAASGRFETTSAISAGEERSFAASLSAAMLGPRPGIRTATRFLALRSPGKIQPPAKGDRRTPNRPWGRAPQWLDQRHRRLADVEIDASLGIGEACLCHRASFVCTRASVLGNPRLCNGLIAAILIVAWPHVRRTVVPARRAGRVGAQI